jgi:hypothetical protein
MSLIKICRILERIITPSHAHRPTPKLPIWAPTGLAQNLVYKEQLGPLIESLLSHSLSLPRKISEGGVRKASLPTTPYYWTILLHLFRVGPTPDSPSPPISFRIFSSISPCVKTLTYTPTASVLPVSPDSTSLSHKGFKALPVRRAVDPTNPAMTVELYQDPDFPRRLSLEIADLEGYYPSELLKETASGQNIILDLGWRGTPWVVFVDGACPGNGTPSARGGYGVFFGPNSE